MSGYTGMTEARRQANRRYYERHREELCGRARVGYRRRLGLGGRTKREVNPPDILYVVKRKAKMAASYRLKKGVTESVREATGST